MPYFKVETNIPNDKIPDDLPAKLCIIISKTLGKPINYCCATVVGGVNMSWGGDNEPAAQAVLTGLAVDDNKKHAKVLFDCIYKSLGVPVDRMYIHFTDAKTSEVGYKGTTFQELIG
ncbi:macrophage migration inhibitory factor homolog [Diabrotica virgifera virgifera]|uniref:L-dopachrome isomerase n=1 Tax=Diabrotica virgifera virgifera TaxID=50390 RepID=A0A6P7FZ87_DIAVI|nr:macrophage migration inhibitory factor homolog [Diabrotica virgifera virgifera]XP_028137831.1 macrophage migration inhibitory factor homolog [Diabrotica virgifera virgifera]